MVISMTGYGRAKAENDDIKVLVEMKTVNHRFCEYNIRMPRQLMYLEDKVKKRRMNIFAVDEAKFLSLLKVKILSLKNSNLIGELLINFLSLWNSKRKVSYPI